MNLTPKQMRAIAITKPGGPEVLALIETPVPTPNPDEVLIRVHAAGVNRPDCLQRAGLYPLPPGASPLPGLEVAGEIVACGEAVTRWHVGERVAALTHGGGYAEFCVANAGHCLAWPTGLSAVEAAGLPETCFTVHHNMLDRGRLRRGETVLIHGGSSGIGSTAIQVAKALGASVITTAGSTAKCDYCLELGAANAINYRTADFEEEARKLVGAAGLDVVLDMVAGPYVMKNIRLLGNDGRYVMIAFLQGATAEINFGQVLPKRLTITGSTLRPQSVERKSAIAAGVAADIWPLVTTGQIQSRVHAVYTLEQASEAHRAMESSTHMGKLILSIVDP